MYTILNKIINRYAFAFIAIGILLGTACALNADAKETNGRIHLVGKLIDQYGTPIQNAKISIKGENANVLSNTNGIFEIDYNKGNTLEFSHPNCLYKEIKVNSLKKTKEGAFNIFMQRKNVPNSETISGPFVEKDKTSYLGSASTVYTDQLNSAMSTTIIPSLTGRLSGLNIYQYRGAPLHQSAANYTSDLLGQMPNMGVGAYSDNTEYSISSRGNSPVVVVDGVQRELFSLDPEAIESVSIQKDALSSMFLGMRSSRGALIITTKKPIKGTSMFSFSGRFGVLSSIKKPKPLSAYQYAYLLNEALQNDGKEPFYSYDDFTAFRDHTNGYTHPDVNWFDQLLHKSSTTQSYNLNVTGGNDFAQYFVNLGYMDEGGLFKEDSKASYNTNLDLKRYLITSKVNLNITRDFTASITMLGRIEEGRQPGSSGSGYSDLLYNMYITPNNGYPVRNPNGTWGGNVSFTNNLMSQTENSGYISDNTRDILGAIYLKYNFDRYVKGLSVRMIGNISAQYRSATNRTKTSPVYQYKESADGSVSYAMYGSTNTQSNSFTPVANYHDMYGQLAVDYERQFGLHTLKASLTGDTRQTLVNYDLPQLPSNINADVSYDYGKKYFAQIAVDNSYYNRYKPGKRWGTFYAFGLGWDISKQSFMNKWNWLNQLKIRAVYGKTGNGIDNSGYYSYGQTFSDNGTVSYMQGTSQSQGIVSSENSPLANPNLTWEKANKFNIGTDVSAFDNKIQLTADYFNDKYYDLLQSRGKSIELIGISYPYENIGKVRRYGLELSLTYQNHVGNLNYYVTGNWNCMQTKLLYMDEQDVSEPYLRQTGHPVGAVFGLVADGFFTSKEEIANSPVISGFDNIQPGDIKYKDLNNDGVINEFDRKIISGDKPAAYFGLELGCEYRGFEFSMLWQGAYNRDMYMGDLNLMEGFQTINQQYGQAYQNMLGRWTPETAAAATFPRLTAGGNAYNRGNGWNSSFWMHSGNYIRLKNINIAYNLPDVFCHNLLCGAHVKIFISGQNLYTKSAYSLVDPEVSFTSSPLQRCINTGINIKF
jgi:TonB-linked SusC/RagA family outer membrane protein